MLPPDVVPAWLPGDVVVQVSGETFHAVEIRQADRHGPRGGPHVAVLVVEPGNPHDHSAIAVLVNGFHVGYLSREIAPAVQPSLIAFTAANSGRPVACPAQIIWHEIDNQPVAQVVLHLNPAPLGLAPDAFRRTPEIDRVIQEHLCRLDTPAPVMTGYSATARGLLAHAEVQKSEADATYEGATPWPEVEGAFLQAIRALEHADDPLVGDAWAGLARSIRYQKGRRDDRITGVITSLYWDRSNKVAWAELVDLASTAPHIPTLLDLFRRVPANARPRVLTKLISLSRGQDRLGNMRPADGERLRAELAAIAEAEGDKPSIRKLSADARKHQASNA